MRLIEGSYKTPQGRVAVVASRFNEAVVQKLLDGAVDTLKRHGVDLSMLDIIRVPGAFEIPLACAHLFETNRYNGIIALGCIIRGSTAHFDHVAGQCASGIANVALKYQKPVVFEVLATETVEDAMARAGGKAGNKGADAALVLLEMCDLLAQIHE